MTIHPTAVIHPKVKVGKNVTIGPFCVLDSPDIVIEDHVHLMSHVVISGDVTIGEHTTIWPFASIGARTQALNFSGEKTPVRIGKHCMIRESVTINSSSGEGSMVVIGDYCLIMAYCHVAHNCKIGHHVVMANCATLAGHVQIGDYAVLGGLSAVHQFVRIGDHAMIGGGAMLGRDLPPYSIGSGYPFRPAGLNLVGLKRRGFTLDQRKILIRAYRITLESGLDWKSAREEILDTLPETPEIKNWIEFCDQTKRGLAVAISKKKMAQKLEAAEV